MAVIKTSNLAYTKEQALIKRIKVEQNFAQQVYVLFREKKFGITPCCYSDYESAVLNKALCDWVITHNLGKFPSVTIVDVNNEIVIGDIDYTSSNIVTVTFNNPFAGCAFLNSK